MRNCHHRHPLSVAREQWQRLCPTTQRQCDVICGGLPGNRRPLNLRRSGSVGRENGCLWHPGDEAREGGNSIGQGVEATRLDTVTSVVVGMHPLLRTVFTRVPATVFVDRISRNVFLWMSRGVCVTSCWHSNIDLQSFASPGLGSSNYVSQNIGPNDIY